MCDKTDFDLHARKDAAPHKCIGNGGEHEFGDDAGSVSFLDHIDLCAGCFHHCAVGQVNVLTCQLLHDRIISHPTKHQIRIFLLQINADSIIPVDGNHPVHHQQLMFQPQYDQMNNNLDILDSQDISLKKQLEKDAAAFREEKFRPEPEQYTELLDTRIHIRPDFRDKLIEQLKGTFGKYYDYHRRDIAANKVDYLNVEDPDVFSHRAWELEYQRKQEMRRNQPVRSKKRSHDMEL